MGVSEIRERDGQWACNLVALHLVHRLLYAPA